MNQFLTRLVELTDEADLLCSPQSVGQSGEATLQCFVSAGCSSLGPGLFDPARRRAAGRVLSIVTCRDPIRLFAAAWLGQQFGPYAADNILWKHLEPSHLTAGRLFDRATEVNRDRALVAFFGYPCTDIGGMSTNCASQCAGSSAFEREVSFQVHAGDYSDSLQESNSESHVLISSVLL